MPPYNQREKLGLPGDVAVRAKYPARRSALQYFPAGNPSIRRIKRPCFSCFFHALPAASAMNGLGVLYQDGNGVPRNTRVARQWFEKAAALGNPEAKLNLKEMRK
jgi:TPR repeat protein